MNNSFLVNIHNCISRKSYKNNNLVLIFIIYLISNIFFLLNDFLFWDDWVWTGNKFKEYFQYSRMLGNLNIRGIFFSIIYIMPPNVSRLIILLVFYLTVIFLYKILEKSKIENKYVFSSSLIFSLLPIVIIKYSLSISLYFLSLLEFVIASYLFICQKKNKAFLFLSLILFFLSFQMSSLLFFYAVIFIYSFYIENNTNKLSLMSIFVFFKKNLLHTIIPFLFFAIKILFYNPLGIYGTQGYNSISLANVKIIPKSIIRSALDLFSFLFSLNGSWLFLFIFISVFFIVTIFSMINSKKNNHLLVILFCFVMLFFALVPYALVGKIGDTKTIIESRHYFLTLFPITFLIVVMGDYVFSKKKEIFILFIIMLIYKNLDIGYKFYQDKLIGQSFIENIKGDTYIEKNEVFVLSIDEVDKGYFTNQINDYILFGYFWKAFGTENHIGYNTNISDESNMILYYDNKNELPYKIKNVTSIDPTYVLHLHVNEEKLTFANSIKIMFYTLINKEKYITSLKEITSIKTSTINYSD